MDYIIILCFACVFTLIKSDNPTVKTNYGKIRGFSDESKTLSKFLGIPFAKPPIGSLRLMKPEKPDPWTETLDTLEYKDSCYENSIWLTYLAGFYKIFPKYEQSEDCLYLNIFVPGDFEVSRNEKKAVMFYIYGGGYFIGNAEVYPGDTISTTQDVIVVTTNYRISLFGFMASEDDVIPGNMGLFDQHAALKWINENIAHFGGDPTRITLFGQSAGADSVINHLASPLSRDLFYGGIIQSPPMFSKLKSRKEQYTKVLNMAEPLCGRPANSKELLTCLQALSAEELNNMINDHWLNYELVIIDGNFLPDSASKLLANGNFDKSKIITVGYTGDDGDFMVMHGGANWTKVIKEGMDIQEAIHSLPQVLDVYFQSKQFVSKEIPIGEIMANLLYREYLRDKTDDFEIARGVIDMHTDAMFSSRCFEIADIVTKYGGTVYLYKFDHMVNSSKEILQPNMKLSAGHGEEIFFEFMGATHDNSKTPNFTVTDEERQLSFSLMKAFTEVSKTGKPVFLTNSNQDVAWQPYTTGYPHYLEFTTEMTEKSIKPVPQQQIDHISLWSSILTAIYEMGEQLKGCADSCTDYHHYMYGHDQKVKQSEKNVEN